MKFAIKNPNAQRYAPAHALVGEDSVEAELVDIAMNMTADPENRRTLMHRGST